MTQCQGGWKDKLGPHNGRPSLPPALPREGSSRMRNLGLLIAVLCLTGCSQDVVLQNPATGASATCHAGPLADINPWSQLDSCVGSYVAEGWVVKK